MLTIKGNLSLGTIQYTFVRRSCSSAWLFSILIKLFVRKFVMKGIFNFERH